MKNQRLKADIRMELIEIGHKMKLASLPNEFIANAVETAFHYEGIYDLMKMWDDETSIDEKNEIIADIQELIDDCAQKDKVEGVFVRFDDLEMIAKHNRSFKNSLLMRVNQAGGMNKLSQLSGIPQPSLSRFFNSSSMPQRTTLLKIAKALNLSQVEIATEWSQ